MPVVLILKVDLVSVERIETCDINYDVLDGLHHLLPSDITLFLTVTSSLSTTC